MQVRKVTEYLGAAATASLDLGAVAAKFFIDEKDLALGKALAQLHDGVVYPGHPGLRMFHGAAWTTIGLPVLVAGRLEVNSRDKRIRYGQSRSCFRWSTGSSFRSDRLQEPSRPTASGSSNVTGAASRPWLRPKDRDVRVTEEPLREIQLAD